MYPVFARIEPERGGPPSGPARNGTVARVLHWVIALLVALQILAGIAMTSEPLASVAHPLRVAATMLVVHQFTVIALIARSPVLARMWLPVGR